MPATTLSRAFSPVAHRTGFSLREKPLDVFGAEMARVLHHSLNGTVGVMLRLSAGSGLAAR
jgi:hypothetical protein